jgi:diguanylate cyclase (GGDEF)-like protein
MNPRHHPFPLVGRWLLRLLLASAAAFGFGAAQAQAPAGLALMAEVGRQAMDDPLAAERQVRKRLATQRGAANTETAFWLQLSLVDLLVQTDREADSRRELAVARSLLPQGPSARGHHLWLKFYERFAQPGPVEMAQFQATQALARDEARAVGDEQLLCALQMHEAVVQVERDAVDEAWAALERVDQCATRQADAALQAYALGTMGPLAARVGAQGEQPQAYYQRALRALGEMPARFRRAWLLDDLAWAQFKAGETAAARRGFEQVLALSSEIADVSGVMRGHEGMAEVLLREKDAEGALRQARLALAQARAKEGLRFRLVTAQTQVVEALAQLGRLAELAPEIDSLRAMTAQDPSPHTAVLISRSAARGLRALGRHAEAYQELEQFVELTATDQRQQRERDAQRLQARYDAVRRDAENKELRHAAEVARLELDARNQRQRALWALVATLGVALAGGGAYFARALRRRHRLAELALRDELTGAPNRRAVLAFAREQLGLARRLDLPLSLALIDMDRFKQVNDHHGHAVGDRVLIAFVRAVARELRGQDRLGRWGGEEWLLVMPGTRCDEMPGVFQRLRDAMADQDVPGLPAEHGITFSMGAAERQPALDTVEALVAEADRHLYRAKAQGRNTLSAAGSNWLPTQQVA